MSPSVSVPEKTLEHWSSQYITYRYRSKAALWWPANGEDIDVDWLPTRPGKAVQLELKTTTPTGSGLHNVMVDLGQLWEYLQRPLGHQPFYAFPWPDWAGKLTAEAKARSRAVTELAFARSGPAWCFADWMVVLTAAQVATVLQPELAAHGSKNRGTKKRLVQIDSKNLEIPTWGPSISSRAAPSPGLIGWREFWSEHFYTRRQVVEMTREAAAIFSAQPGNSEQFVTLEPDAEGNYQIPRARADNIGITDDDRADEDRTGEIGDHRQVVFLDARALKLP